MKPEHSKSQSQLPEVGNEAFIKVIPEERLIEAFSNQEFLMKLSDLETSLADSPTAECAQRFTALPLKSVSTIIRKKISRRNTFPRNSWFDKDCKESKRRLKSISKQLKSNPNDPQIREAFWKERKAYKAPIRSKKHCAIAALHAGLKEFKAKYPREFWKKIHQATNTKTFPYRWRN